MLYKGSYKVIIVGSGPAGVTSSLYLKRAGIDHLVISINKSSLDKALIENYYGFESISGSDLYNIGLNQIKDNFKEDEVIDISVNDKILVKTLNDSFDCDYLILATGKDLGIKEIYKKYLGMGVSICAHCDAPLYRNRKIYYTGDKKYIDSLKEELELYSKDLEYIDESKIDELGGLDYLESIKVDGINKNIDNLFVASNVSSNKLFYTIGLLSKNNKVVVDENFKTNINNIYAVGDLSCKVNQISSAVYSGMMASLDIIKRINGK